LVWLLGVVPAAVVTVLRGRWLLFFVGWFTAGALWFVGALVPDDRTSERERRLAGIATAALAVAFVVLGLFGARPAPLLGMDGRVLQNSVGGTFSSIGEPERCDRKGDAWICGRYNTVSSGSVFYRVRLQGRGCWKATLVGPGWEGVPKKLSGCASLVDYVFG
jgi:hypothetical protein